MKAFIVGLCVLSLSLCAFTGLAWSADEAEYVKVTQADLSTDMEKYGQKKVSISGPFLFTGSDFCVNIRKTKINTKDYFCFALGPISLVRFYLKKDSPQTPELLAIKRGAVLKIDGVFDYLGKDYKYVLVDSFEVEQPE